MSDNNATSGTLALASRRAAGQSALLFAIALFGYATVGNIISLLHVDSRLLSIPFRIVVSAFSAWVFITTQRLQIDRLRWLMLFIWSLYALRLLHDWLVSNLEGADYAFQFFIGGCVLPAIALMKAQAYQQRRFAFYAFFIASVGALTSLLEAVLGNANQDIAEGTSRLAVAALDPVSLGNQAVSAILCGLVLWEGASLRLRFILAGTFALLLWCVILTGSKGPAIALVVCVGMWALRGGRVLRFALMSAPVLIWVAVSSQNPLINRFAGSEEDQSTIERVVLLNDSLQQILDSPIIGSAFVELNSGYYPHNEFLEAPLALGIPVALLFYYLLLTGASRAWKLLNSEHDLLALLFLQALFAASISAAIFGSIALWVTLAMLPSARRILPSVCVT